MSNGITSQCSGTLYDSGGDSSNYSSNENFVYTICSDMPGKCVQLTFLTFDLEKDFDFMYVYNGPSVASPLLGTFTGNNLPGSVTATSGCLTIRFVSDYTVTKSGWKALINCIQCPVNGCPTCNGGTAPSNDACSGAQNLGTLPIPVACPNGIGAVTTLNTSNLCATAEVPYNALQGCKPVGNMATPAADVWYKFTLTAPVLNVSINGMITPQVGLYSGTGCNNLVPRGCAIGGGGLLNATFGGLAAGTYYLQVSGGTITDQCNFSLALQNNFDCASCVVQSALSINPPPVNGNYLAGQSVNFCLNITTYNPTSANWLHGVVPHFGPGWDLSTLLTFPPNSCSNNGIWSWYGNQVTSSANGTAAGPGFFYETAAGNVFNVTDANPGNNFGDNLGQACNLNFCWRISTLPQSQCNFGTNLNVFIDTYSDGESGSWTSAACATDPVLDIYATLACCIPPDVVITPPLCFGQQGSAVGIGNGTGPWKYFWKNASGVIIKQTAAIGTPDVINSLGAGTYFLTTEDANGCQSTSTFAVTQPQALAGSVTVSNTKCGLNNGIVNLTAAGGTAPFHYSITNGTTFQASNEFKNLAPGNYQLIIKDANQCQINLQCTIAGSTSPIITSLTGNNVTCFNGNDGQISIAASQGIAPYTFLVSKTSFSLSQGNPNFNTLPAGNYTVTVTDVNGCKSDSTITITQPPKIDLLSLITPSDCNLNNGIIDLSLLSGSSGTLLFSIDNGINFQTSNIFTQLTPGIYFIMVQDDNGCLVKDTAIINTINAPIIDSVVTVDLTCYRSADGQITIYASGGVGSLQYSINNGTTFNVNNHFINQTAKAYTTVIKDANNCRAFQTAMLSEPPPIIIRGDLTPTKCGLSNGAVSLHPDNGFLPLEYSINGGTTWTLNSLFTGLPSGNITVQTRDVRGCSSSRTFTIAASSSPSFNSVVVADVGCANTNSGSITILAANGTPPISYSHDGGATYQATNSFANLIAGNYALRLKDNVGCLHDSAVSLTQPVALHLQAQLEFTTCSNANGSITLSANGGTPPFLFSINGGASFSATNFFGQLLPGNYKVVVRDANNCEEASTVIITDQPGPRIINTAFTPQLCDGIANASVQITAVSGTGLLHYSVDSGSTYFTQSNIQNIYGGSHFVIVMDSNQCTDTLHLSIPILHSPSIINITALMPTCFGYTDGQIEIMATGGNGNLSFSIGQNFLTTNVFTSLSLGSYFIEVRDSNNCKARDTITLNQPQPLLLNAAVLAETCHLTNGAINLSPTGGTRPYLFQLNGTSQVADSNFIQLQAGTYAVLLTDVNGCTTQQNLNILLLDNPIVTSLSTDDLSCFESNDGSIQMNALGNGPLQFSLDTIFFQSSSSFNNLSAGTYQIYVVDTNQCRTDTTVLITQPSEITATFSSDSSNCTQANGSLTISAIGGTGALTYSFNQTGFFTSNNYFPGLGAGNYAISVQDANGCEQVFKGSVSSINGPEIQSIASVNILCNGNSTGQLTIAASGGTGSLSYSINNGLTFSNQTTYLNLPAGNYNTLVTDTMGCVSATIVALTEPSPISIQSQVTPSTCNQNNGNITAIANGGTGVLSYSLDTINFSTNANFTNLLAGTYFIYVKDQNNCQYQKVVSLNNLLAPTIQAVQTNNLKCFAIPEGEIKIIANGGTGALTYSIDNGITFSNSNYFTQLNAGLYAVRISDQNNCISDTSVLITQPDSLQLIHNVTPQTCGLPNGNISINGTGGTMPYLYSLDSGITFSAAFNYPNKIQGIYHTSIKDAMGCKAMATVVVENLEGPVITNIVSQNVTCHGMANGSLSLNTAGGNGMLTFTISGFTQMQQDSVFLNLPKGNYTVLVTDTNQCTAQIPATISEPLPLSVLKNSTPPSCNGFADGNISIQLSGGTVPYSILWSTGANTFSLDHIQANVYPFTVTDQLLCNLHDSVVVIQPAALQASHLTNNPQCTGSGNASASITVTGGTQPYAYQWSPVSSNTNYATGLTSGNYSVTVTDVKGCLLNHGITIVDPLPITSAFISTPVRCFGGADGKIELLPAGGTSPYHFEWSTTQQNNATLDSLPAGTYSVTITDANGCTEQLSASVTSPDIIKTIATIQNATCFGYTNGAVQLNVTGGISPYGFLWNTNQTSSQLFNLQSGIYVVTVTDANACTKAKAITILEPQEIMLQTTPSDTLCIGQQTILNSSASGGNGLFTYHWSNGNITDSIQVQPVLSTFYTVYATDSLGCNSATDSAFVFVYPPLAIQVSESDTICSGKTVTLSSLASGGNGGPYAYSWSPSNSNSVISVQPSNSTYFTVSATDQCTIQPAIDSVQIIVHPTPVLTFTTSNYSGCQPLSVYFFNQSSAPSGTSWIWNLGDGTMDSTFNPSHTYLQNGIYSINVVATTSENCRDSILLSNAVEVFPLPTASFTVSDSIVSILHPIIEIKDNSSLATSWNYTFGDNNVTNEMNPTHTYQDTGRFTIIQIVSSEHQCMDTSYREIIVNGAFTLYIPNAFTPNNDGSNEFFFVNGYGITDVQMLIFNRWGNKVFEGQNASARWNGLTLNGQACPQGVYVYSVKVRDMFGQFHMQQGQVMLLR